MQEDLFTKSLQSILSGLEKMNKLGQNAAEGSITEWDFRNAMHIIDFCLKNGSFPNPEVVRAIADQLLVEYERSAFKYRADS
jgi:hypothetical protein